MLVMRSLLATLLLTCDPVVRVSQSWGITGLSFPAFFASNGTCTSGESCASEGEEDQARGVPSRPGEESPPRGWPFAFDWLVRLADQNWCEADHNGSLDEPALLRDSLCFNRPRCKVVVLACCSVSGVVHPPALRLDLQLGVDTVGQAQYGVLEVSSRSWPMV